MHSDGWHSLSSRHRRCWRYTKKLKQTGGVKFVDIQKILKELEFNDGSFPREALAEAIANRNQIIPELLEIIKQGKEKAQELIEQKNYMARIYAMFLLAEFREKSAYSLIVDFFSLPGEISLNLTGDVVTEYLARILASVSCSDDSLMAALIENDNANEYVRHAALRGLVILVACGEKSREEIMAYYQSLFREKLTREHSFVWNGLVSCCTDLYPEEVYEDIKQTYEEGLIETFFIRLEDVQETLALGKEKVLDRLKKNSRYELIKDTVSEMEWWACFKPPKQRREVIKRKKIRRNDPCPCGSGKKYKKCCGSH